MSPVQLHRLSATTVLHRLSAPTALHRLNAPTALHRLTAPTALHRHTAPTALHRLTAPTALQCQRQTQSSISIICTPKLLCQNIEISNAKIRRTPTFGHINKSRKHLTHSKFPKHGNFTKFKPSETSHVHLVSILRIPVFDLMQKNKFFHSSPLNFCHHVCSLLGIHYLLRAHFSHRSRAHCWFHRRKNRTPFSGPEAVSFFCSFRD